MLTKFMFRVWDENMQDYWSWDEIQEDWESEGYYDSVFREDHWTCEQYIRLQDKNKKPIYENDLVLYKQEIAQVVWCDAMCCFGFMLLDSEYTDYAGDIKKLDPYTVDCEVIGNIHENIIYSQDKNAVETLIHQNESMSNILKDAVKLLKKIDDGLYNKNTILTSMPPQPHSDMMLSNEINNIIEKAEKVNNRKD